MKIKEVLLIIKNVISIIIFCFVEFGIVSFLYRINFVIWECTSKVASGSVQEPEWLEKFALIKDVFGRIDQYPMSFGGRFMFSSLFHFVWIFAAGMGLYCIILLVIMFDWQFRRRFTTTEEEWHEIYPDIEEKDEKYKQEIIEEYGEEYYKEMDERLRSSWKELKSRRWRQW